jgi:hypothetical protein
MKNIKSHTAIKVCVVFITLFCNFSYAEIAKDVKDNTNALILEEVEKQNILKASKSSVEGKLASCNLEYKFAYRDFRAKKGSVVMVIGQLNAFYFKGKSMNYGFKLVPHVFDIEAQNWITVMPAFVDIYMGGKSMSQYKTTEFLCENSGKCQGYGDSNLEFTQKLLNTNTDDMVVKFSLAKGGLDTEFSLSKLMKPKDSIRERLQFSQCVIEVAGLLKNDLDELNKSK